MQMPQFALSLLALLDSRLGPQLAATSMIFGFFRTAELREFADSIVAEYDRLARSTAMRDDSAEKRQQKFGKLSQKVDAYCREHKLNFYKKSKLLYVIEQGLAEKGVAASEITNFLGHLLARGLQKT
jgi:hypothetical protein